MGIASSYTTVPASNADLSGVPVSENNAPSTVNNGMRQMMADTVAEVAHYTTLTATATLSIGTAASWAIEVIAGGSSITRGDTIRAGTRRLIRFRSALTLTHHASAMILPGAANITTADGDHALFLSLGAGNWEVPFYQKASGAPLLAASESVVGGIEHATDAEVRAATTGNLAVTAAKIESASALVALSDAAPVAVDWDTGINFSLTVTASRAIGNPTNGQPGTWRTILVQGNDATDRTITFGNQYLGEVPTITDCDSGRWYLLTIFCVTSTHFVVSSKKANGT